MPDPIKVMQNEMACVNRQITGCDRDCIKCDLVLEDSEIIAAYEAAIEALKHKPEWIPATERLPEDYVNVLCQYEYLRFGDYNRLCQSYEIGYYVSLYEKWFIVDGNGQQDRVLAWMYLPEPYREVK